MDVKTLGIDLGKNVFHVGLNDRGQLSSSAGIHALIEP